MNKYIYKGREVTINELADMSGIAHATLRDRLRKGFTVEQAIQPVLIDESVSEFCKASWYQDWIGKATSDLYNIYWNWCVEHEYLAAPFKAFSRQLMSLYPNLKVVPTKHRTGKCNRVIRER